MEDAGTYILRLSGLCYSHLAYFVDFIVIWYIFPRFGMLRQ
jgi:hypothetical protein